MSQILKQYASKSHLVMPALGEETAMRMLNRQQLVPIYLRAQLVAQHTVSSRTASSLTLSDYAQFIRDMRLATNLPLIADVSGQDPDLTTTARTLTCAGGDVLLLDCQALTRDQALTQLRTVKLALTSETEVWMMLSPLKATDQASWLTTLAQGDADAIVMAGWDEAQLATMAKLAHQIPLLATGLPDTQTADLMDGWLDTGRLIQAAKRAQRTALMAFMGEMITVRR